MSSPKESGYRILNILLVESHFKRLPTIPKPSEKPLTSLDLKFDHQTESKFITVNVNAVFNIKDKQDDVEPSVTVNVSMIGRFETFGDPELPLERFAEINAPAMIYPFIREHISSLSLKAGIGQILIPPLNFTKKRISQEVKR